MDNLLNILRILSIAAGAMFAGLVMFTDVRDERTGKRTRWARWALLGILLTSCVSLAIVFLEAGEALPSHRESPKAGGDLPFQLVSCHARWSVHSVWRDTPMLLRLQRGEPALYLNPGDAASDPDYAAVEGDGYAALRYDNDPSPVSPAACSVTVPTTSSQATGLGSLPGSISSADKNGVCQRRLRMSKSSVVEAREWSMVNSPVSRATRLGRPAPGGRSWRYCV